MKYGYAAPAHFDLEPGGAYRSDATDEMRQSGYPVPDTIVDGEVLESDPPRLLVQTWRMLMDPSAAAEGFTRLTYDIEPVDGATRLTVTHEAPNAPSVLNMIRGGLESQGGGGGWAWILSDLKSLLETGEGFARG